MEKIKLSFIICSYNSGNYLNDTISSIFQQKNHNFDLDIVLIDDGSDDGSADFFSRNERIKFVRIPNSGIELATNIGLMISESDFFVRVDSDDSLRPNFLDVLSKVPLQNSAIDLAYFDYIEMDENSAPLRRVELPHFNSQEIKTRGDFLATGCVVRTKLFKKMGGYDASEKNCGLEHYKFVLDLLAQRGNFYHQSTPTFFYRRHSNNISTKKRSSIIAHGRKVFAEKNYGVYQTNEFHPYGLKIYESEI